MILLHNFSYIEKEKAFALINKYAELGGKVMVETSPVLTDSGSEYVFPPMPVTKIHPSEKKQDWDLALYSSEIGRDVSLANFGPAVYGEDEPWSYVYAQKDEVKDGADIMLTNYDQVVMAGMPIGEGKIIWSGLNLFYHLNNFKSADEAEMLENMFDYLRPESYEYLNQAGQMNNSQEWQIVVEQPEFYQGVLLKENYFPAWRARVISDKYDFNAKIYRAGPDMMYVDLNPNLVGPVTVKWYYFTPWYQYLALLLSASYLIFLLSKIQKNKKSLILVVDESASRLKEINKRVTRESKKIKKYTNRFFTRKAII
jgi:hypothetical protein